MRKSCKNCAFKHLSAARVLYGEIMVGYHDDDHLSLLIGHLEQAESHTMHDWPEIAKKIRAVRKSWAEQDVPIDFAELFSALRSAIEGSQEITNAS